MCPRFHGDSRPRFRGDIDALPLSVRIVEVDVDVDVGVRPRVALAAAMSATAIIGKCGNHEEMWRKTCACGCLRFD